MRTSCVRNNCNPIWAEIRDLKLRALNETELPPLIMDIYDKDTISANDFMCRSIAFLDPSED